MLLKVMIMRPSVPYGVLIVVFFVVFSSMVNLGPIYSDMKNSDITVICLFFHKSVMT